MKKKAMTVEKRFLICIFLMIFCFLIVCITLFLSMEQQKKDSNQLLEANRSVYEVKSAARNMVEAYYNFYLLNSQENQDLLNYNISDYENKKEIVRTQILGKYYIRQIDDYVNMLDTLSEQVHTGMEHLTNREDADRYQEYKDISYTAELIDGYYEWVYDSMQQFNTREQNAIAAREKVIFRLIGIVCIITLVETLVMLRWFNKKVLEPISQVTHKAALFRADEKELLMDENREQDELQIMSKTFDDMMERIEGQLKELQAKNQLEKLLKESEIKAMQARINPHFMFNTLNSCAQMAYLENAEQTEHMLESVSDYFRYNLKDCNYIVTFADEIKNIEDYIAIQKMRFSERIEFQVDYDETVKKANIPALIIQPLVENAIVHGVGNMTEGAKVKVSICEMGSKISIVVKDNGIGMNSEAVILIGKMKKDIEHVVTSDGIGLSNVYGRLKGCFQDKLVFQITSETGNGTTIRIVVPFIEEKL